MQRAGQGKTVKKTQVRRTLDQKHTEHISKLDAENQSVSDKRVKLYRYELELEQLQSVTPSNWTVNDTRRKSYLMNKIGMLKQEINSIENYSDDLEYISKTLPILINYYDNTNLVDDTNNIPIIKKEPQSRQMSLMSFLAPEPEEEPTKSPETQMHSKQYLSNTYDEIIDDEYCAINICYQNISECPNCGGERLLHPQDGCWICEDCGLVEEDSTPMEKVNYKESSHEHNAYAYSRNNHLTEILNQLQAKGSTDIPPFVFDAIYNEINKHNINKDNLSFFKLRDILKKLKLNKYYKHVPHILQVINGKEPPNFTREQEQQIKKMFHKIQIPSVMNYPPGRKNFLNYSYVLHKFCELLELDEFVSYFPLLKNHKKLSQNDKIWKKICEQLRWKFYKSI